MLLSQSHRREGSRPAALFCLAAAFAMAPRTAAADAKSCIRAHSTGQRESKAGHLRLASQLFTSCGSDESCPDQLRKECAEFLETVKKTIPTVIFSVLDEDGQDVSGAKVYSSDELLVDGLDGRAFEIDPGNITCGSCCSTARPSPRTSSSARPRRTASSRSRRRSPPSIAERPRRRRHEPRLRRIEASVRPRGSPRASRWPRWARA